VINILNVNDAPVANLLEPITILEDEAFSISLAAAFQDEDVGVGDSLTYQLSGLHPEWLVLDKRTGLLSGQPSNSDVGSWQIGVEARDQSGAATQQTVKLVVINYQRCTALEWCAAAGDLGPAGASVRDPAPEAEHQRYGCRR